MNIPRGHPCPPLVSEKTMSRSLAPHCPNPQADLISLLLTSEVIPVRQWAAGQEEGRDSSCWACRVHRAGMGSFSEKNKVTSKPFMPALWESRLGVNCLRLGHDILFFVFFLPTPGVSRRFR